MIGSRRAVAASSNDTLWFRKFDSAFFGSHSIFMCGFWPHFNSTPNGAADCHSYAERPPSRAAARTLPFGLSRGRTERRSHARGRLGFVSRLGLSVLPSFGYRPLDLPRGPLAHSPMP